MFAEHDLRAALSRLEEYRVIKELGKGGFGMVFLVQRKSDGKYFAAKLVDLNKLQSSSSTYGNKLVDLARQECEIIKKLSHPNIVQFIESKIDNNNILCIVMEYCEKGDLLQAVNKLRVGEHFPEDQLREWAAQLTFTLKHLHGQSNSILHRDVKPNNVFLSGNGRLKLGDFGIAKILDSAGSGGTTAVFTPHCQSPEWCKGKPYTAKSEAWSLGILMYKLAARHYPFYDDNRADLVSKILHTTPEPISNEYSDNLGNFIVRLLDKNCDSRMSIAEALEHPFLQGVRSTELSAMAVDNRIADKKPQSAGEGHPPEKQPEPRPDAKALLLAAEKGDLEIIHRVAKLEGGPSNLAKIRAGDETGDNLVHRATRHGQVEIVQFLLLDKLVSGSFSPNDKNKKDDAALHLAAARNFGAIVSVLAKAGAKSDELGAGGDYFEALSAVIGKDSADATRKNVTDGLRMTALHIASQLNHTALVKQLVKLGANVLAKNSYGTAAIHSAAGGGHLSIVKFFIVKKGVDIEIRGRWGRTPLHYAAVNNMAEIVDFLLKYGADVNSKGGLELDGVEGCTPLYHAAYFGSLDAMRLLLDHGADIAAQDSKGFTPLHSAAYNGHIDAMRLLLDHGADITAQNSEGFTPLHQAAYNGHVDAMRLLVDHGADITAQNSKGFTPLHQAAYNGRVDAMQLLVDHGADIEAKTKKGRTPLGCALGKIEAVKYLRSKGADIKAVKTGSLLFLATGKDGGRPAWHYVILDADFDKIILFLEKLGGTIVVSEFGKVIRSGYGESPPEDVKKRVIEAYVDD